MERSSRLVFFVFLIACTVAVLPAAGPHFAAVKKATVVDSGMNRVDTVDFSADLSRVDRLYAQLLADYGYRPAIDPLAAFSEGAPVLTPEAAALALRNGRFAAARLTLEIVRLENVFADRENGSLSTSEFEKSLFETLLEIEALAREIRSDVYVDLLVKLEGKTETVATPAFPRQPVLQLRHLAEEMEQGLGSYGMPQTVQVVSVKELRRPSLNVIAGAIEQLTLELRADRGAALQTAE